MADSISREAVFASLDRALAALTCDEIAVVSGGRVIKDAEVPLLRRSIGQDLLRAEAALSAKGQTLLSATAAAIDEALLAITEAKKNMMGDLA